MYAASLVNQLVLHRHDQFQIHQRYLSHLESPRRESGARNRELLRSKPGEVIGGGQEG